jgi:ABC-type uncharacterized transport system permease subunit
MHKHMPVHCPTVLLQFLLLIVLLLPFWHNKLGLLQYLVYVIREVINLPFFIYYHFIL